MPEDPSPGGATLEFAELARALRHADGVTLAAPGRRFGAGALQVDGHIFAMVSRGSIVLKLPAHRVAALIATGEGRPFDAGKGRPLKEWVALEGGTQPGLISLAQEAMQFVGGGRGTR